MDVESSEEYSGSSESELEDYGENIPINKTSQSKRKAAQAPIQASDDVPKAKATGASKRQKMTANGQSGGASMSTTVNIVDVPVGEKNVLIIKDIEDAFTYFNKLEAAHHKLLEEHQRLKDVEKALRKSEGTEFSKMSNVNDSLQKQLENLSHSYESDKVTFKSKELDLEKEKVVLAAANSKLSYENSSLRTENVDLKVSNTKLSSENSSLGKENANLKASNAELNATIANMQTLCSEKVDMYHKSKAKLISLIDYIRRFESEEDDENEEAVGNQSLLDSENREGPTGIEEIGAEGIQQVSKDRAEVNLNFITQLRVEEDIQVKKKADEMNKNLKEKEGELEDLEALNLTITMKERKSNDELQEARKKLIHALKQNSARAMIGVKRMGEIDSKPFLIAGKSKYAEEANDKSIKICSLWQDHLRDPSWHPFKIVKVGENHEMQEIIDEDEKLSDLRREWGEDVYKAVTTALLEMNEYNASGRYPTPDLWNFREKRRATMTEGIAYVLKQKKRG